MPLSETAIIALVNSQTDPSGNPDDSNASLKLWIANAAGEIQRRRGQTTEVSEDITLVDGQFAYDLPAGCVTVEDVLFERGVDSEVLDVPTIGLFSLGCLPNGQEVEPSVDLISRQKRANQSRREAWRVRGGQLHIECPFSGGEVIRVEHTVDDRDIVNVPERYAQNVVDYCRMMMIRTKLDKLATVPVMTGDGLESRPMMSMRLIAKDLQDRWEDCLSGMFAEAG